jgi:hypothetical protein
MLAALEAGMPLKPKMYSVFAMHAYAAAAAALAQDATYESSSSLQPRLCQTLAAVAWAGKGCAGEQLLQHAVASKLQGNILYQHLSGS